MVMMTVRMLVQLTVKQRANNSELWMVQLTDLTTAYRKDYKWE